MAEDLEYAASLGVNMCGFIFHEKSPRYIHPQEVKDLPDYGMARIGVFVNHGPEDILEISRVARLDYIQLHGKQDASCAQMLGRERIIRVIWPEQYSNIKALNDALHAWSDRCSMFLLDAGKSLGGSGKTIAQKSLQGLESPRPWMLAGGLSPQNIINCLTKFSPDGIDINSGIENSPALKDHKKMHALMNQVINFIGDKV